MITVDVTPVPLNATACGLPVALSAISNVAVRVPAACGVNSTLIVQLAPAASVPAAVHPPPELGSGTLKSSASAPLVVNPAKFTAAVPVFVTITLDGALVVLIACAPNVKPLGVTVTVAAPPVAVPVSVTVCGLPVALSVNVIVPVRVPVAVGLNVIEKTHGGFSSPILGHCASVAPAKSPLVTILLKISANSPLFDTVTVCAALVVPTTWLPNVNDVGVIPITPATPVPFSVTVCGLPVALSVNVIVPVRTPAAVGVNVMWNVHGVPSTAMLGHCASVAPAKSPLVTTFVNVTGVPPVFDTVSVCDTAVVPTPSSPNSIVVGAIVIVPAGAVPNVAVTVSSALSVTVQLGGVVCGLAGVQFPLKLVNVEPVAAVAVSTTALLPANVPVQVEGQVIPAGELVTVPVPEPLAATVSPAAPMPDRVTVCSLPAVGASSEIVTVPV
jgi:hypothetical protein